MGNIQKGMWQIVIHKSGEATRLGSYAVMYAMAPFKTAIEM